MSNAQLIAKAINLTKAGDFAALRTLFQQTSSSGPELCLRILLSYLPQGTEPETYTPLLEQLAFGTELSSPGGAVDPQLTSDEEAQEQVQYLRLQALACHDGIFEDETDSLVLFLVHQARKIDAETGSLDQVRRLLEPFRDHSPRLRTWMIATLLPLMRLEYETYTDAEPLTMQEFESLNDREAIQLLLSGAKRKDDASEELKGLVAPWIRGEPTRKRRKTSHPANDTSLDELPGKKRTEQDKDESSSQAWSLVNQWLLESSLHSFRYVKHTLERWHGPEDYDYGDWGLGLPSVKGPSRALLEKHGQLCMAIIYANGVASVETLQGSLTILQQNREIFGLQKITNELHDLARLNESYVNHLSRDHLSYDSLLDGQNTLTVLSDASISLLRNVLASTSRLFELYSYHTCRDVLELMLFSTNDKQRLILTGCLNKIKGKTLSEDAWRSSRLLILWLHGARSPDQDVEHKFGVFGNVPRADIELEVLNALLETGHYKLALDLYCANDSPLGPDTVEKAVLAAASSAYNAASNGNKTRGAMKKAFSLITTFRGRFLSERFAMFTAMVAATHSISFYSLALQSGVPSRPAEIGAQKDAMFLIESILDQNRDSYTHLDDLMEIGQNLILAGLGPDNSDNLNGMPDSSETERRKTNVRRQVTRLAIEAALSEDDFDTAYSYVMNRLSPRDRASNAFERDSFSYDDISWRGAYAAGRYPLDSGDDEELRRLEQGMELLSQALLLAPPSALAEVLSVWQDCEQKVTQMFEQDTVAEREADDGRAHQIPGGFSVDAESITYKPRKGTGRTLHEEAPMGLFDVAREVGSTLSKSAFPLRAAQGAPTQGSGSSGKVARGEFEEAEEGASRVRKRDMVSDMVTGGLASGIGWVIGELESFRQPLYQSDFDVGAQPIKE